MDIFTQYFITFGWAITGAISMAISLGILVKLFSFITPINEWEELRQGNMAVAIVMAAVVFGAALVIAFTIG
ncbi:MAG: hypothetical protein JWL87_110 [Candidatus Adlerbacteria bacterium]|nr:hypothetical protein [Candidatus Adlerbacteria bacterium]